MYESYRSGKDSLTKTKSWTMKASQDSLKSTAQKLLKFWVAHIPCTPGWDSETVPQPPTHFQQCLTGTWRHSAQQPKPALASSQPQELSQSLTPPKTKLIFFLPSQVANLVATFEQWPVWSQKFVVSWKEKTFSASWIYCLPPILLVPVHSSQQLPFCS